jgi:hypothetical protein
MNQTAPANDPWDWWRRALAEPHRIGDETLPIHADSPELGFFRIKPKTSGWVPVAFFLDAAGDWAAERGGKPVEPGKVRELWTWACRNPVDYAAYERATNGEGWIDEPVHGIGHNLPVDVDERERLLLEYQGERDQALVFLKSPIADQAAADRAAIWSKRLATIASKADELHGVEKRPFLDGGKRVDDRWRDLREEPSALAKRLKRASDEWLQEQDRLEKERQRLAGIEATRLRREAEAAATAAIQSATPAAMADAGKLVAAATEAERVAAPRPVAAGRTGAKLTLRTFTFAVVSDWTALFVALSEREELRTLMQGFADKAARAGIALPGCAIQSEKRAV